MHYRVVLRLKCTYESQITDTVFIKCLANEAKVAILGSIFQTFLDQNMSTEFYMPEPAAQIIELSNHQTLH